MNVGKSTVDKWARLLHKERTDHETNSLPISAEQRKMKYLTGQAVRRAKSVKGWR